jgi:hypothetical protein
MDKKKLALELAAQAEAAYQVARELADQAEEALESVLADLDDEDTQAQAYSAGETAEDGVACDSLDLKAARIDAWATTLEESI